MTPEEKKLDLEIKKLDKEVEHLSQPEHKKLTTWLGFPVTLVAVAGLMLQAIQHDAEEERSKVEAKEARLQIDTAKLNAEVAKQAADKAKQDADTAKLAADKAKQDANTAKLAAEKAKTEADAATQTANIAEHEAKKRVAKADEDFKNLSDELEAIKVKKHTLGVENEELIAKNDDLKRQRNALKFYKESDDEKFVAGKIVSSSGAPLSGVRVSVIQGGGKLGEDITDSEGGFLFKVPAGDPYSIKIEGKSGARTLGGLSSRHRQQIVITENSDDNIAGGDGSIEQMLGAYGKEQRFYGIQYLDAEDVENIRKNTPLLDPQAKILGALREDSRFKEGVIFTDAGIYFNGYSTEKMFIPYDLFSNATLEAGFISIKLDGKKVFQTGYTTQFMTVLEGFQRQFRRSPFSTTTKP